MALGSGRLWTGPCTALLLTSLALPAVGASVHVLVTDAADTPLPDTLIQLVHDAWADAPSLSGPSARTDSDGSARFDDLLPGRYRITLDAAQDGFVRPEHLLAAGPVRVEIHDLAESVSTQLKLHRGPQVRLGFHVNDTERRRRSSVTAVNLDTSQRTWFALGQDEPRVVSLVPGRWNMTLDPPAGLLLAELRANGNAVQGDQVNVDLRDLTTIAEVDWNYAAMARVVGHVSPGERGAIPRGVEARARLLRPGPWYEDVRRRGGSDYARAASPVDPATGRFGLELSSGRWSIELVGPDGAQLAVPAQRIELQDGGVTTVDFEVDFAGAEGLSLATALAPAVVVEPSVTGRLYCHDGTRLPRTVDVRAPQLQRDAVPLTGNLVDRLTVGPVPQAVKSLELRPSRFDRWTPVEIDRAIAGPGDFGAVAIDCAPLLRVSVEVTSGRPAPDLRDLANDDDRFELEGTVRTPEGDTLPVADYRIESSEQALIVRGLPAGEASLQVNLEHSLFLPEYRLELPVEGTLAQGRTLEAKIVVDDVGGAIAVRAFGGIAARLMSEDGRERRAVFHSGDASLPNLPSGSYRLDVCADTACGSLLHSWPTVVIRPLQLVDLIWPD